MHICLKYDRRKTTLSQIGALSIGSESPIRVQTMANVSTNEIEQAVAQAKRCIDAGAELVRFTTQGAREVESIRQIREELHVAGEPYAAVPLVADVHFRAEVADLAAAVVEKVRVNPGNYANDPKVIDERFSHLLHICREHGTGLRIGVNHGSLSARMVEQYGDTPRGMVESCMEFLRIAVREQFKDIVLSIKASNTRIMVETVRLLVQTMDQEGMAFPIHLGVTEAGEGEDGRIKSAVGIGALLADGIGDTVRVSLSEEPEAEIPVAQALVRYFADPKSPRYTDVSVDIEDDVVRYTYPTADWSELQLNAAAECGRLLWEYRIEKIEIVNPHFEKTALEQLGKDILQAARVKIYKTEFTSCPGCGRTMFDLQKTVGQIKVVFREREGAIAPLKIAIMGCIVNGPGEMADADFGYVGAGKDRISLYKGKECIAKNIPQEEAVARLLELIQKNE